MCGIFGNFNLEDKKIFYDIGINSETRGKEASGFMQINNKIVDINKFSVPFSNKEVKKSLFDNRGSITKCTYIGHTRLKTHGDENFEENNQPVVSENLSVVHNGIVTNYKDLIKEYQLVIESDLDSEVIPALINHFLKENKFSEALKNTIRLLSGEISFAGTFNGGKKYFLYTNTGSIYYVLKNNTVVLFTSEEWISDEVLSKHKLDGEVLQLKPNTGIIIDLNFEIDEYLEENCNGIEQNVTQLKDIVKNINERELTYPVLKRCKVCILPETVPFLDFDKDNICNFCKEHKPHKYQEISKLLNVLEKEENIVAGFSGGRDSSYGLSYLKKELSNNFVAVSYDWGMVTDLARRNQARVVGKLGVEHVWVSADIQKKRANIKKNFIAWLSKPEIGMVPILMAGDKEWQKQLFNAAKNKKTKYIVQFQSPFEHTYFKYGFAGIKPIFTSGNRSESYTEKYFMLFKLSLFYMKKMLSNPKYLNSSLLDSLKGFFSFYFKTGKILSLFEFIKFDENYINEYLQREFSWECDDSTPTTWRIGDGTAPIYNYIYWIYAGFTENDFFRSNQIREGHLTREKALKIIHAENQPRPQQIRNYCELIDLDYDFVMSQLYKLKMNSLVKSWDTKVGS